MDQFSLFRGFNQLEAIILDLGGVLLNIDYSLTAKAFEQLSGKDFDTIYSQAAQQVLFDSFETGQISEAEFRKGVNNRLQLELSDNKIDRAWNAMLLDFPLQRMQFLEALAMKKPLYLLSNTNEIHIKSFEEGMESGVGLERFRAVFKDSHYSSRIGMRKPHPETFKWVLDKHGLEPNRTLFIDDSIQHVEGARSAGLHSIHLEDDILDLFGFLGD